MPPLEYLKGSGCRAGDLSEEGEGRCGTSGFGAARLASELQERGGTDVGKSGESEKKKTNLVPIRLPFLRGRSNMLAR